MDGKRGEGDVKGPGTKAVPNGDVAPGGAPDGAPVRDPRIIVLSLKTQQGREKVFKLHKGRIVIGSVISADVLLTGEGVAPIHAVLEMGANDAVGASVATVYDLASETGVFVNGRKTVTGAIKPGDQITVGHHNLKFSLEDVATTQAPQGRVRETGGRKLYFSPQEDLAPLLLEDERDTSPMFDYRATYKESLEIVMSWYGTILDVRHFTTRRHVTLGHLRDCDFVIPPVLDAKRFRFVTRKNDNYILHVDQRMTGVIQRDGALHGLEDLKGVAMPGKGGYELPMRKSDFAKIRIGEVDFYISFTSAPPRLRTGKSLEKDPLFFKIFTSSMLLTAVTIIALMNTKVPQNIEAEQLPERIATILYQPEKFVQKPKIEAPQPRPKPVVEHKAVEKKPLPVLKPRKAAPKVTKIDIKPNPNAAKKPVPKVMDTGAKEGKKGNALVSKQKASPGTQNEAKEGEGARAKGKEGRRGQPKAPKGDVPQDKAFRPAPQGGPGRGAGNSQVADEGNVDMLKGASNKIQDILGNSAQQLGKGGEKLKGFGGFTTQGSGGFGQRHCGRTIKSRDPERRPGGGRGYGRDRCRRGGGGALGAQGRVQALL